MSGHSKWAQIKRKKGATDAKRGQRFSMLTKQLTVAARTGQNLDMVTAQAKAANMPKSVIERAIQRGSGAFDDGNIIESITYEAYGPGGAAILIATLTDNRNRMVNELRAVLTKCGGRLADAGSVQFLFTRQGELVVERGQDLDATELALIDSGAESIQTESNRLVATTPPEKLQELATQAAASGCAVIEQRLATVPIQVHPMTADNEPKLLRLLEAIDELDDVENVETNAELQ